MTWFGSGKDQIKYYVQANQAAVLDSLGVTTDGFSCIK